jgi:hypothetical protein
MCRIFTNAKILRGGFIAMAIQLTLIYNLNVISLSLSLSLAVLGFELRACTT